MPTRNKERLLDESPSFRGKFPLLADFMRPRFRGRAAEMVWFVAVFVATGLCFSFLIAISPDDDDQALRLWKQSGPFSVAVFAPAGDLQAGPTSFGVLVQDRNRQEVLLDSAVDLSARPAAAEASPPAPVRATREDSENKLLQTAELDLPAGAWTLNIALSRRSESADLSLPFRVVKREGGLAGLWPYFLFPGFGMVLLGSYVRRHHEPTASPLEQHVSS